MKFQIIHCLGSLMPIKCIFSTRIFCGGVPGFATNFFLRCMVSCINHSPPGFIHSVLILHKMWSYILVWKLLFKNWHYNIGSWSPSPASVAEGISSCKRSDYDLNSTADTQDEHTLSMCAMTDDLTRHFVVFYWIYLFKYPVSNGNNLDKLTFRYILLHYDFYEKWYIYIVLHIWGNVYIYM